MNASRWLLREWDDGCVVFDRLTGDTHALDPLSAELLRLDEPLRCDPVSAARALARKLGPDADLAMLQDASRAAIEQLRRIELI